MFSALVSGSSSPVFVPKVMLCSWARPFTLTVPLSTRVLANLMLGVTLQLTSNPSRGAGDGGTNTPSCSVLQKSEICAGLMVHLART